MVRQYTNILKEKNPLLKSQMVKSLSMNNVDFKRIKFDLKSISSLKNTIYLYPK